MRVFIILFLLATSSVSTNAGILTGLLQKMLLTRQAGANVQSSSEITSESTSTIYQFTISGDCMCTQTGKVCPGATLHAMVEFYDDYIVVNGVKCTYSGSDNESYIYKANNNINTNLTTLYYVSKSNATNLYKMAVTGTATMMGFNGMPNIITTTNIYSIVPGNLPVYYAFSNTSSSSGYSAPSVSSPSSTYSGSTGSSTSHSSTQRDCTYCNGTGTVIKYMSVPNFGNTTFTTCQECGQRMSNEHPHAHMQCSHCRGTGKAR